VTDRPLRLFFDVQGELLDAARECEAEVFRDRFGNTAAELEEAYGPYRAHTHFLAVVDAAGAVAAVMRLIWPGPAGLKTLDDLARPPWGLDPARAARRAGLEPESTLDVATLAVRNGMRRRGFDASHALAYGLFGAMRMNGIRSMVAMIDAVPYELLRGIGLRFPAIPGAVTRPYFGSPATTPIYGQLEPLLAAQARLAPVAHRAIRHGVGLSGVQVPEPEELRLSPGRDLPAQLRRTSSPSTR
jgi:hypothetical protein